MQTPVFKDIDELSQKATIAGTEKLPVSDTEYITPDQIAALAPSQEQSDWDESDQDDPAYIKNKPTIPDVSGKADKVSSPTSGHFAGLDGNGNLTDSGSKASDFATASQGGKADTAYQKPSGGIPKTDLAAAVKTSLGKADTAVQPEAGKGLFSGSYNDLTDKPTIPDISNCVQKSQTAGLLKNDGTVDTTSYGTYSKPSGGIPSSDLASAVQTSLGKADMAYQKPSGGIPASDMASGVIPDPVTANPTVPSGTTPATLSGLKVGDNYYNVPSTGIDDVDTPSTPDGTAIITLSDGSEITLDLNHNHPAYYSKVAETSNPSGGFLPDVVYSLGTLTGTVTFALAAAVTGNINHYYWIFSTGSTAPTITWPTGITWADGSAPTVAASKHYEVSVLGGIAYYSEV